MAFLAVVSCSRPPSYETFVLKEDADYGDTYSFNLDFFDSLSTFDLSLYTRMERQAFEAFPADSLDLRVNWISPSDSILTEDILLDLGDPVDSSYFHKDYICSLSERVVPFESGTWRLRIMVRNNSDGLRGLGVIFRRNDEARMREYAGRGASENQRWDTTN